MNPEQIRTKIDEGTGDVTMKGLTDLMFEHWEKIDLVLREKDEVKPRWALCWQEIGAAGREVIMVGGLLPALDMEGKEIPGMRANPVIFCIPKDKLSPEEAKLFDNSKRVFKAQDDSCEAVVKRVVEAKENFKFYCFPGWGAPPATFALPLAEAAARFGGVGVIGGMLGSMGTSEQKLKPRIFVEQSGYDWDQAKAQAAGLMYQIEGKEAFNGKYGEEVNQLRRVVIGHSMFGRVALRMFADLFEQLPGTYYIAMTPLLKGSDSEHVILGKGVRGLVMAADREILGRVDPATREQFLLYAFPLLVVREIVKSHIAEGEPYGGYLVLLAHILEYICNPWAVMNSSGMIKRAGETLSPDTQLSATSRIDTLMIVAALKDKVLGSRESIDLLKSLQQILATIYIANVKNSEKGEVTVNGQRLRAVIAKYNNHYLSQEGWSEVWNELRAAIGWNERVAEYCRDSAWSARHPIGSIH